MDYENYGRTNGCTCYPRPRFPQWPPYPPFPRPNDPRNPYPRPNDDYW